MSKPSSCFVVMPFCDTQHGPANTAKTITQYQWEHIFKEWIKKAVESYKPGQLVCKRSLAKPGSFIKGIVSDLASAELVVADLTGARPNVYYELGIRHALRTGTIIITQDQSALPSDLSNYFAFVYEYSDKGHEYAEFYRRFEAKMHETIKALEDSGDPCDSPVSDFLGIKNQILQKELEIIKNQLRKLLMRLKKYLLHNVSVCKSLIEAGDGKTSDFNGLLVIDTFPLETVYTRLISYDWHQLEGVGIEALEDLVTFYHRIFSQMERTLASLSEDAENPSLQEYLVGLLTAVTDESKELESFLDDAIASIDDICLKKG